MHAANLLKSPINRSQPASQDNARRRSQAAIIEQFAINRYQPRDTRDHSRLRNRVPLGVINDFLIKNSPQAERRKGLCDNQASKTGDFFAPF
jgi:hypothetical protein